MEGLELVRSALSEGRRGLVESWLRVGKLELGAGLATLLRAHGFQDAMEAAATSWHLLVHLYC